MRLKTLKDINLKNKTVLYRAPYDIETKQVGDVFMLEDDMRIRATLPTLKHLLDADCKIVILTYVGRPDGKVVEELRTTPHAKKLSELLDRPVAKADDCIGPLVLEKISAMQSKDILMLENVRFYQEEMVDDDAFAEKLCAGKDLIVFDGFPQAHRMHASTSGIERHLPAVAGMYLEMEVNMLSNLLEKPEHPFTVIIGGAKISDKVDAIRNLLKIADTILVGGAVANVFLKAVGFALGSSFIEDVFVDKAKREKKDWVEDAGEILKEAETLGKKIIIPKDLVISDNISIKVVSAPEGVPEGWRALDIGLQTQSEFSDVILKSKTVFLAGPIGKFEDEKFSTGSKAVLMAMKNVDGSTIIAGGDTIGMVRKYGNLEDYSHVSLAAGATLEFLAGKELPALVPLMQ